MVALERICNTEILRIQPVQKALPEARFFLEPGSDTSPRLLSSDAAKCVKGASLRGAACLTTPIGQRRVFDGTSGMTSALNKIVVGLSHSGGIGARLRIRHGN